MRIDRDFTFKAKRNYLHSTSLFDDIVAVRQESATDLDFRFARKTGNQVSYIDNDPSPDDVVVAEWADAHGRLFVVERNEPIKAAVPYDEEQLVRMMRVESRTVDIPATLGPFSRIDALVAGFKLLLQRTHPDIPRKYVFVRIRMTHVPAEATQIVYTRDIGPFFQGDIHAHGQPLGQIFFGEWQ